MFLQPPSQRIQQQASYSYPKPASEPNPQPIIPEAQQIPITQPPQHMMQFIPPPINDSSKYHDQLQNDFLQTLTKNPVSVEYLTLFGEKRPLDINEKKLPEPLFVDDGVKMRMKKVVRGVYQKMIENLKYCAGEMPISQGSPLQKIEEKAHEFMLLCDQVRVAETKATIWKIMQEQTRQMNAKAQEMQEFIQGMVEYCKAEKEKEEYE